MPKNLYETQMREINRLALDQDGPFEDLLTSGNLDEPVVVIGLGGLGLETVNCLKGKYNRAMKGRADQAMVRFFAIDTHIHDLEEARIDNSGKGNLLKEEEFCLVNPLIPAGKIRPDSKAKEWFSEQIDMPAVSNCWTGNGSGQIRQIGRLMLVCNQNYTQLRSQLERSVYQPLYGTPREPGTIRFLLVSGLAGGTGSGILIDVAYLLRNLAASLGTYQVKIDALLYTPDIQIAEPEKWNPGIVRQMQANTYAALKEINYYMDLGRNGGSYQPPVKDGGNWESREAVFESCTLLSALAQKFSGSKTEYVEHTAEMLLDLLTDLKGAGEENRRIPLINLALPNTGDTCVQRASWIASHQGAAARFPEEAVYKYQLLGQEALEFPYETFLAYGLHQIFQGALGDWKQKAQPKGISSMVDLAEVRFQKSPLADLSSLTRMFIKAASQGGFLSHPDFPEDMLPGKRDVRDRTDQTMQIAEDLAKKQAAILTDPRFLNRIRQQLNEILEERLLFVCSEYGPYLTERLIKEGVCVMLFRLYREAEELLAGLEDPRFHDSCYESVERAAMDASGLIVPKSRIAEYARVCSDVANEKIIKTQLFRTMQRILSEIKSELEGEQLAFEKIRNVKQAGEMLDRIEQCLAEDAEEAEESTCFRMGVKSYLDSLVTAQSVSALQKELLDWMLDEFRNTRRILTHFLYTVVGANPMQKLLEQFTGVAGQIGPFLSQPAIKGSGAFSLEDFGYKQLILLSDQLPEFSRDLYMQIAGLPVSIVSGQGRGRFSAMSIAYGLPLYAMPGIVDWQRAYRQCLESGNGSGLHSDEIGEDMTSLPEPYIPERA